MMGVQLLANVALPTFFGYIFSFLFVIWVVIAIEAVFVNKMLNIPYSRSYKVCTRANIYSTLVGMPFAWFLSFFIFIPFSLALVPLEKSFPIAVEILRDFFASSLVFGGAPPYYSNPKISFLASAILLIPYYYASVWLENKSLRKNLPDCDPAKVKKTVIQMNRCSYGLICLVVIVTYFLMR
jgi:hypothetical protein